MWEEAWLGAVRAGGVEEVSPVEQNQHEVGVAESAEMKSAPAIFLYDKLENRT